MKPKAYLDCRYHHQPLETITHVALPYIHIMDVDSEQYTLEVALVLVDVLGSQLIGIYLHGSAALGGFNRRRSDINMLAVVDASLEAPQKSAVAEALGDMTLPCPACGLELTIVTSLAAQSSSYSQPNADSITAELHLRTSLRTDTRIVNNGQEHDHASDADLLVLALAVCHAAGRSLGAGLLPTAAFSPVPDSLIRATLLRQLQLQADQARPNENTVLEACRAWHFAVHGTLVSKVAGGEWALDRVSAAAAHRGLVATALGHLQGNSGSIDGGKCCVGSSRLEKKAVKEFVQNVVMRMTDGKRATPRVYGRGR